MAEIPQEAKLFKGSTRERVRRAIVSCLEAGTRNLKGRNAVVSVTKARAAGSGDQNATTALLRLWRGGHLSVGDSWDDQAPSSASAADGSEEESVAQLRELIESAQDHDDLLAAEKHVASLVLDGMGKDGASALTSLLREMRLTVEQRAKQPKDEVESVLPCTEEALPLVETFEGICDDERRARVMSYAQSELEADKLERPSLDTGAVKEEVGG